jgi:ribosomal protein L30/L7E
MLIRIVGTWPDADTLLSRVQASLEELGLLSHTAVELYDTPEYREQMKIVEPIALCIEEESINFRDMIFEGVTPEQSELTSLFISLFGAGEEKQGGCGTCTSWGCETCSTC